MCAVSNSDDQLEMRIIAWRAAILSEAGTTEGEADRLAGRLRDEISSLSVAGLSREEAFLVGIRRLAETNRATRAFVAGRLGELWMPSSADPDERGKEPPAVRNEALAALGLAVVAAGLVKIPELFGYYLSGSSSFYARNLSFFVLPALVLYFAWKRGLDRAHGLGIAGSFVVAAVVVNAYPFATGGASEGLAAIHLPIALWLFVGIAYTGARWTSSAERMNFVRFSGELFIYYVLLALGGGLLTLLTGFMFGAIGVDIETFLGRWVLPCGAAGAFIIASWLVETKAKIMENMAPVLTRVFTPLFAAALLAFLVAMLVTGRGINIERNVLIGFDLLLVVVFGLLLYAISSRDSASPPGLFDWLQLLLVCSALLVDLLALAAIAERISEFGFSANKTAALGLNLIVLVNLAWSARLLTGFLSNHRSFAALEGWQTAYLPVYAGWAGIVVVVFPVMFGFT